MNTLNELIKIGFIPSILEGNIKLHYRGTAPPDIKKAQPLIEELKLHKEQAINYLDNLVIYEIHDDINFDRKMKACLDLYVHWLKVYVFKKAGKVILIGQGHDP